MSKVVWLKSALDDVLKVYDFLAEKNPEVAKKIIQHIKISVSQLISFPESGKLNEKGSRDFFIPRVVKPRPSGRGYKTRTI